MKPLISVIVPVYNGQDFLLNCVKSIEAQTYQNLEVIIINDGSTDGTAELCEEMNRIYDNIRFITLNDKGVSAARNAGIEAAKGEYITFVDADDRLLPPMLEVLYESLIKTDGDIAGCGFESWNDEGQWRQLLERDGKRESVNESVKENAAGESGSVRKIVLKQGGRAKTYTSNTFISEGILKGNSCCWSKLYKRDSIGDIRFRQGLTIGEDMLFLVDLMPQMKKIVEIPYKGYGYYQNPSGAMNRAFIPAYMDQITCWELAREKVDYVWKADAKEEGQEPEISKEQIGAQITMILIMAVMLTVGKLALLPRKERRQYAEYIEKCHDILKRELKVQGAYEKLSGGYKLKVRMFQVLPEAYLCLYHIRKCLENWI